MDQASLHPADNRVRQTLQTNGRSPTSKSNLRDIRWLIDLYAGKRSQKSVLEFSVGGDEQWPGPVKLSGFSRL